MQIPLMYLFNGMGLYPFYGSTLASLLGLATSFITNLVIINKTTNMDVKAYFKDMFKFLYPLVIMIIVLVIMKQFIPFNNLTRFKSIIIIGIYALVGMIIYFGLTIKNGIFKTIFGNNFLKKFKK